jgi:anti-sigma regulatory factor (Ser/Thr protein kinase)
MSDTIERFALNGHATRVAKVSPRKGDMDDGDFSHTLLNGRTGLPALLDALEAFFDAAGAPPAAASAMMIAADEVLSNVLDYSGAGRVDVTAAVRDGRVAMDVVDDGAPFDLTEAAAPDTTLGVEDRAIGGLGIHLVRKLMDEVRYAREGDTNKLSFSRPYDLVSPSRRA